MFCYVFFQGSVLGFIRETAHAHMCTSLAILSVCTGLVSVIIYHATAGRMLIRALVKFNVSNFLTTATSTGYFSTQLNSSLIGTVA